MKKTLQIISISLIALILFSNNIFAAYTLKEIDLSDINNPHDWAKEEVNKAKEMGLLTENTDNYFKENITRSQFAELVTNLVEKATNSRITPAPDTTFKDTSSEAILKAYNSGIVKGITATEFQPNEYITREQIATMLNRAIEVIEQSKGKEFTTKNYDLSVYTDNATVSSWAKDNVGILAANNIMKGTSDTTLSPKTTATIEQCVLLVYRVYNLVK